MKLLFNLDGRTKNLTPEELNTILGTYFASQAKPEPPRVGQWFKVTPSEIDEQLFAEKRKYKKQEMVRLLILDAFEEIKKVPEIYGGPFETLIPEKTWDSKTGEELEIIASGFGNGIACWVEQALEWAQRIANGETWNALCNRPDISNWYRLILWKDGKLRMIGGSKVDRNKEPSAYVVNCKFVKSNVFNLTVPLIVRYSYN